MWGIYDKSSADTNITSFSASWVKFITERHPTGLMTGVRSVKQYKHEWEAKHAIRDIIRNTKLSDADVQYVLDNYVVMELPEGSYNIRWDILKDSNIIGYVFAVNLSEASVYATSLYKSKFDTVKESTSDIGD